MGGSNTVVKVLWMDAPQQKGNRNFFNFCLDFIVLCCNRFVFSFIRVSLFFSSDNLKTFQKIIPSDFTDVPKVWEDTKKTCY